MNNEKVQNQRRKRRGLCAVWSDRVAVRVVSRRNGDFLGREKNMANLKKKSEPKSAIPMQNKYSRLRKQTQAETNAERGSSDVQM